MGFLVALSCALWSHQPQWELSHSVNWIYSKLSVRPFWESCCPRPTRGVRAARKDFVAFQAPFLIALKCSWAARPWGWSAWRGGRDSALVLPWINVSGSRFLGGHSSLPAQPHQRFARRCFFRFCLVTVRHKPCV